jgi:hypothetical protein
MKMPCSCAIGRRPDADQIDAALRERTSVRKVAETFGAPKSTVGLHRKACLRLDADEARPEPLPLDAVGHLLDAPRTPRGEHLDRVSPFAVPNPGDDAMTAPRKVVTALVERRCVELRASGRPYTEIAAELGIGEEAAADAVERVLIRTARGTDAKADAARALDLERINMLLASVWKRATDPEMAATSDDDGARSYDESQDRAIDRATKLLERRAKLLGLDAPTVSISVEHPKVREELGKAYRELYALLAVALRPHPEALRDVMAAMRQWNAEKGLGVE